MNKVGEDKFIEYKKERDAEEMFAIELSVDDLKQIYSALNTKKKCLEGMRQHPLTNALIIPQWEKRIRCIKMFKMYLESKAKNAKHIPKEEK